MDGKIVGRIVDEAGKSVPEVSVMVIRSPGAVPDIAAVSDTSGHFVFAGLPVGRYRIRAIGFNGKSGEADAAVLETVQDEVVIQLARIC
ncbi:carboxypeptidase-like regulatory domain-containing protein [Frankia sp. EAN1pec]|uniref:carboxypeptidase regulatory-like domain-containing protein n=1 Tax=Parafrankia sp. (strain EAN1pec) TaxID=298653 RepID=UPI0018DC7149